MKHIIDIINSKNTKINEKLVINKNIKLKKISQPKTRDELKSELLKKIISNETNFNNIDVSKVDDFSYLFEDWDIKEIDISEWDVSNATTMKCMFQNCKYLQTPGDLSNWDVSNVEDMSWMFNGCQCLVKLGDLQNWEINGTKMKCMFQGCKKLKTLGHIKHWRPKEPNWDIFMSCGISNSNLPYQRV